MLVIKEKRANKIGKKFISFYFKFLLLPSHKLTLKRDIIFLYNIYNIYNKKIIQNIKLYRELGIYKNLGMFDFLSMRLYFIKVYDIIFV